MKLDIADNPNITLLLHFVTNMPGEAADRLLEDFINYTLHARLTKQREKGYSGWHTAQCTNDDLKNRLISNLDNEQFIDVIALAGMLMARKGMFKEIQ